MVLDNVLSVGNEFDYPLTGGESLYGLLSTFNEKFSLNLTEDNFVDAKAVRRDTDGLIAIVAISQDGCTIYNFVNTTGAGVAVADYVPIVRTDISAITRKPVNFKEELEFLSTVELNTPITYGITTSKIVSGLQRLLVNYEYGNWNIVGGIDNNVADFILRYYGPGDEVPSDYGEYDAEVMVAIVDLKQQDLYSTYCLRTKKYHVYDNGYRSGD